MQYETRTRQKARRAANEAARNEEIRRLMNDLDLTAPVPAAESNQSTGSNVPPATLEKDGKD